MLLWLTRAYVIVFTTILAFVIVVNILYRIGIRRGWIVPDNDHRRDNWK